MLAVTLVISIYTIQSTESQTFSIFAFWHSCINDSVAILSGLLTLTCPTRMHPTHLHDHLVKTIQ